jgi:hypothetical protein
VYIQADIDNAFKVVSSVKSALVGLERVTPATSSSSP